MNHAQTEDALTTAKLQIKRFSVEVQYIEMTNTARDKEKARVVDLYRVARYLLVEIYNHRERINETSGNVSTLTDKMRKSMQVE